MVEVRLCFDLLMVKCRVDRPLQPIFFLDFHISSRYQLLLKHCAYFHEVSYSLSDIGTAKSR